MKANDNDLNDLQRIKALEDSIAKMRIDLAYVTKLLKTTAEKARLKQQKGATEKLIYLAQVEIGNIRRAKRGPSHRKV
jgi:hypothetical protein